MLFKYMRTIALLLLVLAFIASQAQYDYNESMDMDMNVDSLDDNIQDEELDFVSNMEIDSELDAENPKGQIKGQVIDQQQQQQDPDPVVPEIEETEDKDFEDYEEDSRNTSFKTNKKRRRTRRKKPTPFDTFDWKLPSIKQLPGDIVRLRHAPGIVSLNEEVLDSIYLPPKDCPDPNHINDVKLWYRLTKKIRVGKKAAITYKKWLQAAKIALKKVKTQIAKTKRNHQIIERAIRGMIHQRRQVLKRLKSYKLKHDLDKAQSKMKKLQEYGSQLGSARNSLLEGATEMEKKVKLLERGMNDLKKFGEDA